MRAVAVRKRVRLGAIEFAVTLDERHAARIRESVPARIIAGARRRLAGRSDSGADTVATPQRDARLDVSRYADPEAAAIARRANEVDWYHAIELPHGVVTPGYVDHRAMRARYGLPGDMRGMRALEIATFDGFWSFEMERRGASVVAVDIPSWAHADIPLRTLEGMTEADDARTGAGFQLAKELLGSTVDRREMSVYDLDPSVLGTFDFVFVSDLMLHLRDPQRALERIYPMLRPGGHLLLAEPYNPELEGFGNTAVTQYFGFYQYIWSIPSTMTLRTMLDVAGFRRVEEVRRLPLVYHHPFPVRKIVLRAFRDCAGRNQRL